MKGTFTAQDRQRHVEQWRKSGLSQQAYCERHGLTYTSFKNWMRKRPIDIAPSPLVPIEIRSSSDADWLIEATGGLRVHVPAQTDSQSLARLFQALRSADAA